MILNNGAEYDIQTLAEVFVPKPKTTLPPETTTAGGRSSKDNAVESTHESPPQVVNVEQFSRETLLKELGGPVHDYPMSVVADWDLTKLPEGV